MEVEEDGRAIDNNRNRKVDNNNIILCRTALLLLGNTTIAPLPLAVAS